GPRAAEPPRRPSPRRPRKHTSRPLPARGTVHSPFAPAGASTTMIAFRGAYTAIVTPFTADGASIDYTRLGEQLRFHAEGGVAGVVPAGTTGESPTLSEIEQCELIERTIELGRPLGLQVIAGAGSNNTAHAAHLHKFAASAGADATLQVSPYYNKPSQE